LKTIDNILTVIKDELGERTFTSRFTFSLGVTEFDRMLPEHYSFFIDYVDGIGLL